MDPGLAAEEEFAASSRLVMCLHGAGLGHLLRPAPAPSEAVKINSCRCRMTMAQCRQPSPASSHPYTTRSITSACNCNIELSGCEPFAAEDELCRAAEVRLMDGSRTGR